LLPDRHRENALSSNRKTLFWTAFGLFALVMGVIQFVPPAPLAVPALLPPGEREAHRLLNFEGIPNVRDLGGYAATDGRQVKWGVLYRAGSFAGATDSDLEKLAQLELGTFIDFRSALEREEEPDRLPEAPSFAVVDIPILDEGNEALVKEIATRIENGDFDGFDPDALMMDANRQFADEFTPQFAQFLRSVIDAGGRPVLWHCTAGKDRTGFASAILLRILEVPQETVLQDYLASGEQALQARRSQMLMLRLFKGQEAADKVSVLLGVRQPWLEAAFSEIDTRWGDFDSYVRAGLGLSEEDISHLRHTLLQ